ncbi:MAG: hypothetical protein QG670_1387 [Thermoproteota archaeon]|nr:hypothetical protein [Thermoproteota archaeon]
MACQPVFLSDTISLSDIALSLFYELEFLNYSWAWVKIPDEPPATPISESSPYPQDLYLQVLAKNHQWYWIIDLTPIMDLIIKEAGIREESIVIDVPIDAELNKPQYLGSEEDLLILKMRGVYDSIRVLDKLNTRNYILVEIKCNGVTWWKGRVRFINWGGYPQVSDENVVHLEGLARGIEDTSDRQYLGIFGDPPNQDKYVLILKKGHQWDWINTLIEEREHVE